MAIDEVSFYSGECPPQNVNGQLCDFEKDSCQLEFDMTSDYFWKLQRGPTTNQATGPSVDHTVGTSLGEFDTFVVSFIHRGCSKMITVCFLIFSSTILYVSFA